MLLMVLFSAMNLFDRTVMSIVAPSIIKEFDLTETQMGVIFSAFIFSYAALMIPGGYFADRFGPRRVLTVMGLGAGLFTGFTALVGRPGLGTLIGIVPAFVAMRLAFGAFSSPLYPSCGRMNANWVRPERRGFTWGLVAGAAGLGAAISPLLFSWVIRRHGWRLPFWQAAAATIILALIWVWYVRDNPAEHSAVGEEGSRVLLGERNPPPDRSGSTPWRLLLTDRNLMSLTLAYFTIGYFEYIFYFWTYYYLGTVRHMGSSTAALGTTELFLTVTVMTPLGGWISDRLCERFGSKFGRRAVPIAGVLSAVLFLYLATRLTTPIFVTTSLSVAMGLVTTVEGPFWASAIAIGRREVGAACGILNTGGNIGGVLAPIVTPFVASFAGWRWGLYLACLLAIAGALAWLVIDPTKRIGELTCKSATAESVPVQE